MRRPVLGFIARVLPRAMSFAVLPIAGLILLLLAGALATALIASVIEARFPARGRFVDLVNGRLHVLKPVRRTGTWRRPWSSFMAPRPMPRS